MISVWTARNLAMQGNIIQRDVLQHADFAIDLDMDFHARLHKDKGKFLVPTAISHSQMQTVSTTTSWSKCQVNSANSRAYANNATTVNSEGRLCAGYRTSPPQMQRANAK